MVAGVAAGVVAGVVAGVAGAAVEGACGFRGARAAAAARNAKSVAAQPHARTILGTRRIKKLYREPEGYRGSSIEKCELAARVEKFVNAGPQK